MTRRSMLWSDSRFSMAACGRCRRFFLRGYRDVDAVAGECCGQFGSGKSRRLRFALGLIDGEDLDALGCNQEGQGIEGGACCLAGTVRAISTRLTGLATVSTCGTRRTGRPLSWRKPSISERLSESAEELLWRATMRSAQRALSIADDEA